MNATTRCLAKPGLPVVRSSKAGLRTTTMRAKISGRDARVNSKAVSFGSERPAPVGACRGSTARAREARTAAPPSNLALTSRV